MIFGAASPLSNPDQEDAQRTSAASMPLSRKPCHSVDLAREQRGSKRADLASQMLAKSAFRGALVDQ
jgi:hypothetical protein